MESKPSIILDRNTPVVDRAARMQLAKVVRRFLDSELTSFELDVQLDPFRDSEDETVRYVVDELWCYYDDECDHFAAMEKPEWDYLQRLLLLLHSERSVGREVSWTWRWSQGIAVAGLIGYCMAAVQLGFGAQLLLLAAPCGALSWAIAWLRGGAIPTDPYSEILHPFQSFADLKTTYDAAGFRKQRHPREVGDNQIRSSLGEWLMGLPFMIVWLLAAPAVLLVQAAPRRDVREFVA